MQRKFGKNLMRVLEILNGFLRYKLISNFLVLYPRKMMINLTYKCNSKCIMCNIWKRGVKKEMTLEDWKKRKGDKIFLDVRVLTLSGGEVFLVNNYLEYIKVFVDLMPKLKSITMNTNGFMENKIISDIKLIAKYLKTQNIKLIISVSIDGIDSVHNKIRGIEGGFEKSFGLLNKLKNIKDKYSFSLGVSAVLMKQNLDKYEELENFFKNIDLPYGFQIVGFNDTFLENKNDENKVNFDNKDKKHLYKILDDLSKPVGFTKYISYYWADIKNMYKNKVSRSTPCPFLYDDVVLDCNGYVYYCLSVSPIGNFLKEDKSIFEIYSDKNNINKRKKMKVTACSKCNSACDVGDAIAYDFIKYIKYLINRKLSKRM